MTPVDDLDLDLGPAADAYDVPAGDLHAVLRRSRRRSTRHRRGLATLATVSLVGATVAVPRLLDDNDGGTELATEPGVSRGAVGIEWSSVVPGAGLGWAPSLDATTPIYALSTAAGQRSIEANTPRVIWRSDDGVEWTAVASRPDDLFLSDLASSDGRVYAVGTGPAGAAVGGRKPIAPLLVGWSDDGAESWQRRPLPLDLTPISARSTYAGYGGLEVAVSERGVLVGAWLHARLDVAASLPAGVTTPDGWAFSADGVDVLGPEKAEPCPAGVQSLKRTGEVDPSGEVGPVVCAESEKENPVVVSPQEARGVVRSLSWAELGVSGDLLRAVRNQPVFFFAGPGSDDFRRLDAPDLDGLAGAMLLSADADGFDVVSGRPATGADGKYRIPASTVVVHSDDGATWNTTEALGTSGLYPMAAGRVGGTEVLLGHVDSGGPNTEAGAAIYRRGASGWTATSVASLLDPAVTAGKQVFLGSAGVGPFGVVAAVTIAPAPSDVDAVGPMETRILVSRDGETWSDFGLEDIAGRKVNNVLRAAVVGQQVVVAVSITNTGGPSEQLVLVGTPD